MCEPMKKSMFIIIKYILILPDAKSCSNVKYNQSLKNFLKPEVTIFQYSHYARLLTSYKTLDTKVKVTMSK
jgi:hypothetical protein